MHRQRSGRASSRRRDNERTPAVRSAPPVRHCPDGRQAPCCRGVHAPANARIRARALPSGGRRLVRAHVRRAHGGAGGGVAGDRPRPARAGGRADRFGQDPHRLPQRDRRAGAPRRGRGRAARPHRGGLRLAAEGAVQRHPPQPGDAAGRHPRRTGGAGPGRRRDPRRGAHRRHPAARARAGAPAAAAHPGDHARIAVRAAGLGIRARVAAPRAHADRRRDPCGGRQQARQPPGAVAGASAAAGGAAHRPHRPVGHAAADRGGGALPGRCERGARGRHARLRDRRHPAAGPARPGAGAAAHVPGAGDVRRPVAAGLRAGRRAGARAPHHAGVRQHPAHGRARGAAPGRAAGQGRGGRPPRQPGARCAAAGRAAAQGRRAEGAGGHRLAGTGPGHRRGRPGVPARLAALDLGIPAARRPRRPSCRRRAQGAAVPADPRRTGRMRGAARLRAPRRTGHAARPRGAGRRVGAADRRRGRLPGVGRGRPVRTGAPRLAVCAAAARRIRCGGEDAVRGLRHPPWPARRLPAPRRRAPPPACAPRRAHGRAHLRRHHPRDRRLHRGAGAAGRGDRHGQRGLRGGKPHRRRVPARQRQLPHPAGRGRAHARGGRQGAAAQHPVLDGRGAGPQRCAVGRPVAAARGDRQAGAGRGPRRRAGLADRRARPG